MNRDLIIQWRRILAELLQARALTIAQGVEVMKELDRMDNKECEMAMPEVLKRAA